MKSVYNEFMAVIKKKSWPQSFKLIKSGNKKFDLRIPFKVKKGDKYGGAGWIENKEFRITKIDKYSPIENSVAWAEDGVLNMGCGVFFRALEKVEAPSTETGEFLTSIKMMNEVCDAMFKDALIYGKGKSYVSNPIKSSPSWGLKTMLKKATNLIKGLTQPLRNYVRLGWIRIEDDEYVVTEVGKTAYMEVVFGIGGKDLESYAKAEVKRLSKKAKKDEDEENEE